MNEVCMVPWRLLGSRSEQLPRGVSSRAGAFIWEIPVAGCGGVEPGSCRRLPAEPSCGGCRVGKDPCPLPHSWPREQMDGRALPTPWEGNRDLTTVPDAWLLPLPAVEWAGSSKITDRQFLGVRADKRAQSLLQGKSGSGTESRGAASNAAWPVVSFVSSELLSIHKCLCLPIRVMLWSGSWFIFHFSPMWRWNWTHRVWMQAGNGQAKCCDDLSTSKCLPSASFCDIEEFWLNTVIKWKL